jgi:hypothetical protein
MKQAEMNAGYPFEEDYHDAKAYHRRALRFAAIGKSVELIFNVAAIALERYLVALCDWHGTEPMNHNFVCLMNAVDKVMDVPHSLSKEIRALDMIFGICALDETYHHGKPTAADTGKVLRLCDEVHALFDKEKVTN